MHEVHNRATAASLGHGTVPLRAFTIRPHIRGIEKARRNPFPPRAWASVPSAPATISVLNSLHKESIMSATSTQSIDQAARAGLRERPVAAPVDPASQVVEIHSEGAPSPNGDSVARPDRACPTEAGRDETGRFTKGNKGGPGNPFARGVAALRKTLLSRITPERMEKLADRLYELAEGGNVQAIKLILSYTVGKPAETVNPDQLDVEEWQHWK